jgi:hypothetical protein
MCFNLTGQERSYEFLLCSARDPDLCFVLKGQLIMTSVLESVSGTLDSDVVVMLKCNSRFSGNIWL